MTFERRVPNPRPLRGSLVPPVACLVAAVQAILLTTVADMSWAWLAAPPLTVAALWLLSRKSA